ncbi:MAG: hypothetical protein GX542_04135 [Rhodococcus sp.]|nr:hypothetical protein [Rhodococcus sp. (in: high G+C Gram-positive bacteria)]
MSTETTSDRPATLPDDHSERQILAVIGIGRIIWGATTAFGSARVHRTLGLEYPGPDKGVWIKAFGIRDILIGAAALHPDKKIRTLTLRGGIVMDLFDVGVALNAGRHNLPKNATLIGLIMAGGTATFAAIGPAVLRKLRSR